MDVEGQIVPGADAGSARLSVVIVGSGPRGSGLLERLVSNAGADLGRPVDVHLVDPFPPGGGRVWRSAQSELMRLNTTAEDLTAFVDESVTMRGPVTPGPTLHAWSQTHGVDLEDPALAAEAAQLGPLEFPSRQLANAYFSYAFERTRDRVPAGMNVVVHPQRAVDVLAAADGEREVVVLEDGQRLSADAVVLTTSHVDLAPAPAFAALATFADEHGLAYVPPGYGADVDLSPIESGTDVIVRGFGLGFVDLMILLTQGRGGRFEPDEGEPAGRLRYRPSGAEPRLLVGSRRGVPYHCKPMYRMLTPRPDTTRFCTPAAVAALLRRGTPIDFFTDLWPLIGREVSWAYYRELVEGHPGRIRVSAQEFTRRFGELEWGHPAYDDWISDVVPDPADRFDPAVLDQPLRGLRVSDHGMLSRVLRDYIRADLDRRVDATYSADLGAFHGLLAVLPVVGPALGSSLMSPSSLLADFYGWFMGFFSFYASGPPPDRLEQLLALERAGVVQFLGAGLQVDTDVESGRFLARSSSIDGEIATRAMIDATLPAFSLERALDPVLNSLAARGEVVGRVLVDADGREIDTGQVEVDTEHRLVRADGSSSARRFALGMHTMIKAPTFARPCSNAPVHRHNDQVARTLLSLGVPRPASHPQLESSALLPRSTSRTRGEHHAH